MHHDKILHLLRYVSLFLMIPSICLIFANKELQLHPNQIFAYLMLLDTMSIYNYDKILSVCSHDFYSHLFMATTRFDYKLLKFGQDEIEMNPDYIWTQGFLWCSFIIISYLIAINLSLMSIGFSFDLI